ncbi:MAG: YgfZ/GcvT domain-containing protein [Chthoniobacterales bacterium]
MSDSSAPWFRIQDKCYFFLHGDDAERYLNGQVSNNILKLRENKTLAACLLTPKGKLCALLSISRSKLPCINKSDGFLIESDLILRDTISTRLERYIISDDAHLLDLTGKLHGLHLLLPPENLPAFSPAPLATHQHRRLTTTGCDLWFSDEQSQPRLDSATEISPTDLEHERIRLGQPAWNYELNENTLPAEVGLDHSAIDFHKGCYLGQEVISRIQSVGHVNHTLVHCCWTDPAFLPHPPLPLFLNEDAANNSDTAKPVGKITSISPKKETRTGLAIIHRQANKCSQLFTPVNKEHPKSILRIELSPLSLHNSNNETL